MGFMDSVKGLLGKGKDYAAQNPDKAQGYIDKAGDAVDGKTGGKYAQHVDKAQDAAKKHLGATGNPAPGAQPGPGGEPGPQSDPGPDPQPGPRTP
ncbi:MULTISPECIES: Rv0909 family putative TA system antitoxin [unclassified Rhodococcus (in: high G+C Gram-positive bacteria)]|uniref:antitoxin n=1 Tax=Rhodococcus sp. SJ-3 TaxID=3454628 RepID=UPI003F797090